MNKLNKIFFIGSILLLCSNYDVFAAGPELSFSTPPDTAMRFDAKVTDFAVPFALKATSEQVVKFIAVKGKFSIFFRNANQFFEGVGPTLTINIDSEANDEIPQYKIKKGLPLDTEIKCEVYCETTKSWADSPPRIIITSYTDSR